MVQLRDGWGKAHQGLAHSGEWRREYAVFWDGYSGRKVRPTHTSFENQGVLHLRTAVTAKAPEHGATSDRTRPERGGDALVLWPAWRIRRGTHVQG